MLFCDLNVNVGSGFCNYEELESPDNRGQFKWIETIVSNEVQRLSCIFGAQIEGMDNSMATRLCRSNLRWTDYNGNQCATRDTDRLRRLGKVI